MSEDTDKNIIETDGAHIYDHLDGQWYRCQDCKVKVSWQEIDRCHHRLKCEGESR